jgi:NAD-dependent SIR2 family protein deacetylase
MAVTRTTDWAPRVKPAGIRRLYRLNGLGIYDEELLHDVGWGLHERCRDALIVHRAMRGEVPCPECGGIVPRPARPGAHRDTGGTSASDPAFRCGHCERELTWWECREALRNHPRCFDCGVLLGWNYEDNRLSCRRCGREWTWQEYRRSVKARVWLPCAYCHRKVRRPERVGRAGEASASGPEEVLCPRCGATAVHAAGKLSCSSCGREVAWSTYRKRQKRRVERLECPACGHAFTWQSWRKLYIGRDLLTGNPAPLLRFSARWPGCETPQQQMMEIDRLIHAVHARGALGPNLIRGSEESVRRLLDELAEARDAG